MPGAPTLFSPAVVAIISPVMVTCRCAGTEFWGKLNFDLPVVALIEVYQRFADAAGK